MENNSYAPKLPYPNNGGASNNFNGANSSNESEPNLVEDINMVRSNEEKTKQLDTSHVPEYNYVVVDFVKIISMKYPLPKVTNNEAYNVFIELVAAKVRELDDERKKLYSKLPAKRVEAFEPTT